MAGTPRAAYVRLASEPAVAAAALTIVLLDLQDGSADYSWSFNPGDLVVAREGIGSGAYLLAVDGVRCLGTVRLEEARETDVLVDRVRAACRAIEIRVHDLAKDDATAAIGGSISGPRVRLTVILESLDTPRLPVPPATTVDEGGRFFISPVLPGRYRLALRRGAAVVADETMTLQPGEEAQVSFLVSD